MAFKGPVYDQTTAAAPSAFKGPVYDTPPPASPSNPLLDFWNLIGGSAATALDTATFGLASKGADAAEKGLGLGSGHDIQDRLDSVSVPAKIVGTTLGFAAPGGLISKGIGKAVPWLAKTTLPAIFANNAITAGALSTGDQAAREGSVDPMGVGIDSLLGGALGTGVHAGMRAISPKARVMSRGSDLSATDKTVAQGFADDAASRGIPLSAPEALKATVPTQAMDLLALHDSALKSPKGSQATAAFNADRTPKIEAAGRNIVTSLGPRVSPFELQQSAQDAIDSVSSGFNSTATKEGASAATKKAAPSHVISVTKDAPYIQDATKSVMKDRGKIADAEKTLGHPIHTNDIEFLSLIKDQLDTMAARAEKGQDGRKVNILRANSRDVAGLMDRFAPSGAAARDIRAQGAAAKAELEAGPLGTVAKTPRSVTQSNALFGPTTEPEANASHDALSLLPGTDARGALANHIDNQISSDPLGYGRKSLPNQYSGDLIDAADRATGQPTEARNTLEAAAAVDPTVVNPQGKSGSWGIFSPVINAMFNYGKGDIEKILHNPAIIAKLGKMGILDQVLQRFAGGTELTATHNQRANGPPTGLKFGPNGITFDPSTY